MITFTAVGMPAWALLEERVLILPTRSPGALSTLRDRILPFLAIALLAGRTRRPGLVQTFIVSEEIAWQVW